MNHKEIKGGKTTLNPSVFCCVFLIHTRYDLGQDLPDAGQKEEEEDGCCKGFCGTKVSDENRRLKIFDCFIVNFFV